MGLKQWVSKTGIYNNGEEIIDEINPLKKVIEHADYPLARIYRTSFWRGIKDTYSVLVGSHYDFSKGRKGVLDVLIFPLIGRLCFNYAFLLLIDFFENDRGVIIRALEVIPYFSLIAIAIPLALGRIVLGVMFTLILTPVVAIVHAATHTQSKRYKEEIRKLEINYYPNHAIAEWGNRKIRSVTIDCAQKRLRFQTTDESHNSVYCFIEMNAQNFKGIKALLATNTGDILTRKKLLKSSPDEANKQLQEVQQLQQWLNDFNEDRIEPLAWMLRLQKECKATDEGLSADFSQFAAQIYAFRGIATHQEVKKAQQEIASWQPANKIEDQTLQNSLS